jgi:methionine synthase II (cobalamin-independent)
MNFTQYFLNGLKGTLRFNNGKNLSYKGPWIQVTENSIIDEFYVGDFMSAEYTICVDAGNIAKEVLKCLVVAGPSSANITVYARTSLNDDLVELTATVDASRVRLIASPIGNGIKKLFFSANYYYTVNELTSET